MSVLDMSNSNNSLTKDLFPSTALSLSLAGISRNGAAPEKTTMEAEGGGDEGSTAALVEISCESSGPAKSRSEDEFDEGEAEDDGGDDNNKKRKRKKYKRHTPEQIRELEALFKESPHPDEKQRQELSRQLGLHPKQVKFWFQNRRTQIKAIQERHENSLLKTEIDKLRDENMALRETIKKGFCPNCGFAASSKGATLTSKEQQLQHENTRLKAEVEKLSTMVGKYPHSTSHSPTSSLCSAGHDQENKSSLFSYSGVFGLEKPQIMEIVNVAMEELTKMAFAGESLWIRGYETGREILNYDEYMKEFHFENPGNAPPKRSIEASRESGMVIMDLPRLVQSFMDVDQWKEMFPGMISRAGTIDVISNGEGATRNGAAQLMFAELQMLTPLVGTKEVYFVRHCKQLNAGQWAIVDVSIDKAESNIDASLVKCRKRPSGCIIEDKSNGHCKVTWVEHLECQKSVVHPMYRSIVNSGLAFGARRWMATLQLQCERLMFLLETNVPAKDSSGVTMLAGRKSILKLAQRMTWSFCRAVGASSYNTWNKIPSKTGDDVRIASMKNFNDTGKPLGVILCAVSSIWLPLPHVVLFNFLRDETRRHEWDIMSNGSTLQSIANLAKGQNGGNGVSIQKMKPKENVWILQDSCTNSCESMVVYAPVDVTGMQSVMNGCNSNDIPILPSGFSILPDGIESGPLVITSKPEEKSTEGGSLLTIAFQVLTSNSPTAKLSKESVESVSNLISRTLHNIKTILQCDDQ